MEKRQIGGTDLYCSALGFGTWEMSGTMYGDIDVQNAERAVHAAIDHGINLFDTAEVYGPFHSEELLAKALGKKRNEIILVNKVGFNYTDDGKITGVNSKYENIITRTERCLRRMKTDFIDLQLIHWRDHETPLEETMKALKKLQKDGKIRYYGVSNFDVPMLKTCMEQGELAANQVGYHLFDQRMDAEVIPFQKENQIGFMAYGTLGFGLLTGALTPETTFASHDWRSYMKAFGLPLFEEEYFLKELKVTARLAKLVEKYDKSVAQLAISWVLSNEAVSTALVGMRNEEELIENVAAADWRLTEKDRSDINQIFKEEGVSTNIDEPQLVYAP